VLKVISPQRAQRVFHKKSARSENSTADCRFTIAVEYEQGVIENCQLFNQENDNLADAETKGEEKEKEYRHL
jgi:hypothetical protein